MFERLRDAWELFDIDRRVRRHGWTAIYVGAYGDPPSWVYSVGFDELLDQPEIIVFDVTREAATDLLWEAYQQLKDGELRLDDGAVWTGFDGIAPIWRKVHPSQVSGAEGWLKLAARRRHKRTGQRFGPEAFQLVLPGPAGLFPWDDGYNEHLRHRQPALYLPENDPDARDMPGDEREARRLIGDARLDDCSRR